MGCQSKGRPGPGGPYDRKRLKTQGRYTGNSKSWNKWSQFAFICAFIFVIETKVTLANTEFECFPLAAFGQSGSGPDVNAACQNACQNTADFETKDTFLPDGTLLLSKIWNFVDYQSVPSSEVTFGTTWCTFQIDTRQLDTATGTYEETRHVDTAQFRYSILSTDCDLDTQILQTDGICKTRDKNLGDVCDSIGNPCNPATGNKYQEEIDYLSPVNPLLDIRRSYNSASGQQTGFGVGWISPFHRALEVSQSKVIIRRPDGRGEPVRKQASTWLSDPGSEYQIQEVSSGYVVNVPKGNKEYYDHNGQLVRIDNANGTFIQYFHNQAGNLSKAVDNFGYALQFFYEGGPYITRIVDPQSNEYRYQYDPVGNLVQVYYPDGTSRKYHYENQDYPHHLTGITDENNVRISVYGYDEFGRAVSTELAETDNGAGQERFDVTYSTGHRDISDSAGASVRYFYVDHFGELRLTIKRNNLDGKIHRNYIDPATGLVVRTVDEEGREKNFTYTPTDQIAMTTEAPGTAQERVTSYQYVSPELDLPTVVTTASVLGGYNKTLTTEYDAGLNVTSFTVHGAQPDGNLVSRTTSFKYNSFGQVTQIDGARTDLEDVTSMAYNDCAEGAGCGQLASTTNALGHVTTFDRYDASGRLLQHTGPNGLVTSQTYDSRGRLLSITQTPPQVQAAGRTTHLEYDGAGQLVAVMTPDGANLVYNYDAAGYLRSISDNLGNKVEYDYDLPGNRTAERFRDPDGSTARTIRTVYDMRNRISAIDRAGSITQTVHDAVGNLVSITDPNLDSVITHNYDALNRLFQTIDSLGNQTGFQYNVHDFLTLVYAPNTAITSYAYDDLGNLIQEQSPDRGVINRTYDAAGNMVGEVDARGVTAAYTYDALNRIARVDFPGIEHDQSFVYDNCNNGVGRLCSTIGESGVTTIEYDVFGNILTHTKEENGRIFVTRYQYDMGNRVIQVTYPHGGTVNYSRDGIGRITDTYLELDGVITPILTGRTYRADGLSTMQVLGNGLPDERQYDQQGRLVAQHLGGVDSRIYQYDANGNMLSREQNTEDDLDTINATYLYDVIDRIIQETGPGGDFTFAYDGNNNRLSRTRNGNVKNYTYLMASNRLTSANDKNVILDAAGNTLSDRNGKRSFNYSETGRLQQFYKQGLLKATYQYNAQGQRTRKVKHTEAGQKTYIYHYDLKGNLIAETKNKTPLRYYIWVDDQPAAQIRLKQNKAGKVTVKHVTYISTDHLLTPRLGTDENQNIVWRWDGDAFGQTMADKDPDANEQKRNIRLRFPGQFHDGESGLYYNWSRYYDPKIGRHITSDPIGLRGGLNTYAYGNVNPLRWSDPEGLESPITDWPPVGKPSQPLPGYNYCGPGNLPRSPSNALDKACMDHDECYAKCGLNHLDVSILNPGQCKTRNCQDQCDDSLCTAARIHNGWIKVGVRYLFCD